MQPSSYEQSLFLAPSRTHAMIITPAARKDIEITTTLVFLSIAMVVLRFMARRRIGADIGADDWAILASLVVVIAMYGVNITCKPSEFSICVWPQCRFICNRCRRDIARRSRKTQQRTEHSGIGHILQGQLHGRYCFRALKLHSLAVLFRHPDPTWPFLYRYENIDPYLLHPHLSRP